IKKKNLIHICLNTSSFLFLKNRKKAQQIYIVIANFQMYIVINIFGIALLYLSIFFTGADLKPAFRLSRPSINMLVQMLLREKQHSWNSKIEVPVTIYCLACGASYRVTADIFSMPVATVCRIVHSVIEEMMTILHRVIHFPKAEEMEEVGAGFARLAGNEAFRCTAGAIDGCHIRILPPGEPHKRSYINRKLFPSIVLQGICDSRSTFLDVYIGNSGSVHDARVLRRSSMYKQALYPPAGFFLLGDGGYPSLQHPLSTYRKRENRTAGFLFNRHHAKARIIIERTFGILKTRWRSIFLRALDIQPLFAPKVVGACCILHNICVATNDVHQEEGQEEAQPGLEAETEGTEASSSLYPSQVCKCLLLNSCLHVCLNMTTSM
uniref:DDE Tnp4 domain-containing protein n=1 Tax=Oreochromis aureus TaxID=47969 RepID=A0A668S746_OREAU